VPSCVRLRHHVHHVLDAVDLLLDGRGYRVGDDVGVGAGVRAGDHDARRRDRRVLAIGRFERGDGARQGE